MAEESKRKFTADRMGELDYFILGCVAEGINSGYAIKKDMNRTRGGRWSAESGSVYRVLRRLNEAGLIEVSRTVGPVGRERTEYEITQAGANVLEKWIASPALRSDLSYLVEPLRTRSYFLNRIPPYDRIETVRGWMRSNLKLIKELSEDIQISPQMSHPIREIGFTNLMMMAKTRQDWLEKLEQRLIELGDATF